MNASRKNIMIGTAGHVDHGKTALVKLLTGCETDTLEEEKQRGLTIDLGFAPCRLSDDRIVGIVDVPGHSDFIRNMVAGAHGIDIVILVVAADDGIMPQTLEHLQILTLMGLKQGLVALTKIDLVDPQRREAVTAQLAHLLSGTFLDGAPICPVSNVTGEGYGIFYDSLNEVARSCTARSVGGLFRMWVEDVFTIRGSGTVITGIPSAGRIACGDSVVLAPSGGSARVRRIQVYGKEAGEGRAGECAALNIPELDHLNVRRGMLLGAPGAVRTSATAEVEMRILGTVKGVLKDNAEMHLHVGTAAMTTNVAMLERGEMRGGETQMAQLRLSQPLPLAPGERFVLRGSFGTSAAGVTTLGGGRILGCCNSRLRRRKPATIRMLSQRSNALEHPLAWVETLVLEADRPMPVSGLEAVCYLRSEELGRAVDDLAGSGRILRTSAGLIHVDTVRAAAAQIMEAISLALRADSRRTGITAADLRATLRMEPGVVDQALQMLLGQRKIESNGLVFAPVGWKEQTSGSEEALCGRVAEAFRLASWASPAAAELAVNWNKTPAHIGQAIKRLHERGVLIRLDDKTFMHRDAVEAGKEIVVSLFRKGPRFTTMAFRDALGVSRKFAVPLLDYLDRIRYTVRCGHDRTPGSESKKRLAQPV